MADGRRLALLVVALVLAVVGLVAAYVRVELADPDAFADRSVVALRSDALIAVIAEQVAVELLERRSPDLVATRPLVLTAVQAVLETDSLERVLRRTAITAHGVLLDGDDDVVVELEELREVLLPALQSASPALARQVPRDLGTEIAQLRTTDAATLTVRVVDQARNLAWPLLLVALGALVALIAHAQDRRRAAGTVGLGMVAAGGLAVLALAAGRGADHLSGGRGRRDLRGAGARPPAPPGPRSPPTCNGCCSASPGRAWRCGRASCSPACASTGAPWSAGPSARSPGTPCRLPPATPGGWG